jgi:hypothetical protein
MARLSEKTLREMRNVDINVGFLIEISEKVKIQKALRKLQTADEKKISMYQDVIKNIRENPEYDQIYGRLFDLAHEELDTPFFDEEEAGWTPLKAFIENQKLLLIDSIKLKIRILGYAMTDRQTNINQLSAEIIELRSNLDPEFMF